MTARGLLKKLGLRPGVLSVRLDHFGADVTFASANLVNGSRRNAFLQLPAVASKELDSILARGRRFNRDLDGFSGCRVRLEFNSRGRIKVAAFQRGKN